MDSEDDLFASLSGLAEEITPAALRSSCERCGRPTPTCICHTLPEIPLSISTRLHVQVHPLELTRSTRTMPIVELCINSESLRIVEGRRIREQLPPDALLLFPSPQARDIEEFRGKGAGRTLVVLDATWQFAKNMMSGNIGCLSQLTHVQFCGTTPVFREYLIRKQPKAVCMSTLEAIAAALDVLEDNTLASETMIRPLREMVRMQQLHIPSDDEEEDD